MPHCVNGSGFPGYGSSNRAPHIRHLYIPVSLFLHKAEPDVFRDVPSDFRVKSHIIIKQFFRCVSGEEYSSFVRVEDAVMRPDYRLSAGDRFSVKIRSAAKPVPACVSAADNSGFTLLFDPPVRAACPGQSAVLYDGSVVAGGGVISSVSG